MDKALKKNRRKIKIRNKITGTAECPRISIFRSNRSLYLQAIDDQKGVTLAASSSLKISDGKSKAALVSKQLADVLIKLKIAQAVFDRNGNLYHGVVKETAENLRKNNIKI